MRGVTYRRAVYTIGEIICHFADCIYSPSAPPQENLVRTLNLRAATLGVPLEKIRTLGDQFEEYWVDGQRGAADMRRASQFTQFFWNHKGHINNNTGTRKQPSWMVKPGVKEVSWTEFRVLIPRRNDVVVIM